MATDYFKGPWKRRQPDEDFRKRFVEAFPKLCLYDLGAAGGTPPPFLFLGDGVQVVTFEPDPGAEVEPNAVNCPIAIGPKEMGTLYLNRRPTTSSLLRPNAPYVDRYDWERRFPGQGSIFETVKEIAVETEDLDSAVLKHGLPQPDFLKVDVQGLSYEVFEGAEATLRNSVLGLQVEVEFGECYTGQKTMGAVHEYLVGLGYEIYRMGNLNRWFFKTERSLESKAGQDVFCDLTYMPGVDAVGRAPLDSEERILKMIAIFLLFDCNDAAAACLERAAAEGVLDGTDGAVGQMVDDWAGATEMFYRRRTLDKLTTIGKVPLLDTTPRDMVRMLKRLVKIGNRGSR